MRVSSFPGMLAVGCCPPRTTRGCASYPHMWLTLRTVELHVGGGKKGFITSSGGQTGRGGKGRKGEEQGHLMAFSGLLDPAMPEACLVI